ncbi:hypothetical protein FHG87_018238 [Trinorchestia longiramus]|nr:hypothetical protein FHG87_018238 [Trinorchestia longiramus]
MNMTKHDLRLLMLHEFKLGHNASEASANINRAWGEESTRDGTVRRWFGKFRSGTGGSGRRMLGPPRMLETAVPTSKNPHGVWV